MSARNLGSLRIWWAAVRDRWHDLPAPRATALSATEQRIQSAANVTVRALQAEHAKKAEPFKAELRDATGRLGPEEAEFSRLAALAGRVQEDVPLGPFARRALMTVLTVGEAAFNVVVFAIFGEAEIFTIAMALGVAAALPLLAHKTGIALRQYEPRQRKIRWVACLSLLAVAVVAAINGTRVAYLRAEDSSIAAGWAVTTVGYLLVNLAVFAAACLVTYLSRDPQPGFVEAKRRVTARKDRIAELRGRLNQLGERLVHQVGVVHEAGAQAVAFYRSVNRRGRTDVPAYYDDESAPNHRPRFVTVSPERFDEPTTPAIERPLTDGGVRGAAPDPDLQSMAPTTGRVQ